MLFFLYFVLSLLTSPQKKQTCPLTATRQLKFLTCIINEIMLSINTGRLPGLLRRFINIKNLKIGEREKSYSKYTNRENKFREIRENLSIAKISSAKLTHFDLSNRENFYP